MIKISHCIVCVMAIWTAVLLFWTSQSVQKTERELKKLKQSNYSEFEMVRVLSSEWDYLNRPNRLEKLADEFLSVDRVKSSDKNFLTSTELIENTIVPAVPIVPQSKPQKILTLVSNKKKIAESKNVEQSNNIIRKPEQKKFTSMIEDLTEGQQ